MDYLRKYLTLKGYAAIMMKNNKVLVYPNTNLKFI